MELTTEQQTFLDSIDFDKGNGTITVVAQDSETKEVLMIAAANREAIEQTLLTGTMWYLSRERGLWHKGDTSGNYQHVISLHLDCDNDSLLALVTPDGPACHTGAVSCFSVGAHISLHKDTK